MKKAAEQLGNEIQTLRNEAAELPHLKEKVKSIDEDMQLQFTFYRGRIEAFESNLSKIENAFTGINELRSEVRS